MNQFKIGDILNTVVQGDALELARRLPDNSISMICTSPPYWGLRDYQTATWEGGSPECEHRTRHYEHKQGDKQKTNHGTDGYHSIRGGSADSVCPKCGAIRIDQQIGLEATYQEHIEKLVVLFRELRRALHPMGTLWINYGDCYATSANGRSAADTKAAGNDDRTFRDKPFSTVQGNLKPKDLVGMAWRLALALQDDGWILRSDIIWHKPNPMPESVQDRPTKAHEYVFLFAKSPRYFYDIESVREGNHVYTRKAGGYHNDVGTKPKGGNYRNEGGIADKDTTTIGRNKRTVWTVDDDNLLDYLILSLGADYPELLEKLIDNYSADDSMKTILKIATEPFSQAHFATFPQKLIEPMILAGSSVRGVCPECGNPWERVTEPTPEYAQHLNKDWADYGQDDTEGRGHFERNGTKAGQRPTKRSEASITASYVTTGWRPTCDHNLEPIPAVVLDPFFGSGTVGKVATKHRRNWLGFELNPDYIEMSYSRINNTQLAMEF